MLERIAPTSERPQICMVVESATNMRKVYPPLQREIRIAAGRAIDFRHAQREPTTVCGALLLAKLRVEQSIQPARR